MEPNGKPKFITPGTVRLSFPHLKPPEGPQPEPKFWVDAKFNPSMAIIYSTKPRPWWQRWMWWRSPLVAVIDFETAAREMGARPAAVDEHLDRLSQSGARIITSHKSQGGTFDDLAALDAHEADTAATDSDPMGHAPGRKRRTRVVVEFDDLDGDGWRRVTWMLQMALQNHPTFKDRHVRTMHPTRLVQAAGRRKDAGLTSPKT